MKYIIFLISIFLISCGGGNNSTDIESILSIEWIAPSTRVDNTPLSLADIGGYYIYLGKNTKNYEYKINITDGTTQSAKITDLPKGSYFITMKTYDIYGLESPLSKEIYKFFE